jgi:conjugal transfer/entry exclusion protein
MDWTSWNSLFPTKWPLTKGWLHAVSSADPEALKGTFISLIGFLFLTGIVVVIVQSFRSWWNNQRPYLSVLIKDSSREGIINSTLPWILELRRHLVDVPTRAASSEMLKKRTLDASEVMPERQIAPAFISNRLILAMPSILTGLGVLGTFTGLALGMSQINLSADPNALTSQIQQQISTFAGAFSCSVWGVFASLLFSLIEKIFESLNLWSISIIHDRINNLFPRYVPEEALVEISENGRKTSEILDGLALAIGDHMQKAIGRLGQEIKDAVGGAVREGQGPLVEKSAKLLEEAITAELINLKNQIEGMAQKFSESFDGASSNLLQSIQGFEPTVQSLSGTVETAQRAVINAVDKLNSHESVMSEMAQAATKIEGAAISFATLKESLEDSAEKNRDAARAQSDAASSNLKASEEFSKISEGLTEIQGTIKLGAEVIGSLGAPIQELRALLESQPELQKQIDLERQSTEETRNRRILEMSTGLAEKVGQAASQFAKVGQLAEQLAGAAQSLNAASDKLSEFGENLAEASSEQVKASEISKNAAQASERTAKALEPIPQKISDLAQGLDSAGESVKTGAEAAKQSYGELINLQKAWFQGVEVGLTKMKESLQDVFRVYGDQVEGKTGALMKQWVDETTKVLGVYNNQVQSLSGPIEDIQIAIDKINKRTE